jgi:magnesium transporter
MNNDNIILSHDEINFLLGQSDEAIKAHIASITHSADIIEFFRHIDSHEWPRLLRLIDDPDLRAQVVAGFDRHEWKILLPRLSPDEIAELIKQLETDDAADLLATIPLPERFNALKMLSQKERVQVQQLLHYPQDSAGGLMQMELALVKEDALVSDAINMVRELVEDDIEVYSVLVVDQYYRLLGSLALVDLLLNKATTRVSSIMHSDIVSVKPLLDQEEVAAMFKKYDLITMPVVDDKNRVLGRILIDDVVDVLAEEAEEDALHMAGTSAEELMHLGAVFATARVRLPWLGVALCCSMVSAWLLHYFQPTVEKAVIILSFIPVITAMGGNVGTQSATLLIRGFATGKFDLSHVPTFLFKELRVGLLVGALYGLFAGLVGFALMTNYNIYLGLVVFISMACGMMTAAVLGVIAPTLLKKLNIDPAIASGPFVTTFNDITGIIIYMLISTLFLTKLEVG